MSRSLLFKLLLAAALPVSAAGTALGSLAWGCAGASMVRDVGGVEPGDRDECSILPPEATYVFHCEDGSRYVVQVTDGGAWIFCPQGSIHLAPLPGDENLFFAPDGFKLEICGETARIQEGDGEWRSCTSDRRQAVWEAAKLAGADFRAVGNEPGWILVLHDGRIILDADYGTTRIEVPLPKPIVDQETRTTRWEALGLTLEVVAHPCRDTMSGEQLETTVTVYLPDRTLHGCGRALH